VTAGQAAGKARAGRFGARTLLGGLALLLVAVPFGLLLLLVQDRWRPLLLLDDGARDGLHGIALSAPWLVLAMKAVSIVGTFAVYAVAFAVLAVWLVRRGLRRLALFVVVTVAGGSLLNMAVKTVVDRSRPVLPDPVAHASYSSFPSGHAQGAVVACGVLLLVLLPAVPADRRRLAVAAAVGWVLLVGFSRVVLGVHYVSDVVGGYLLGLAWLAVCAATFGAWRQERGRPGVPPAQGLEPEAGPRLRLR